MDEIIKYIVLFGIIALAGWAMWHTVAYKTDFPTVMAGTERYAWSGIFHTRFSGKFSPDKTYKFKHNDLMFIRATNTVEGVWKLGDWLICNTTDDEDFVKGGWYLLETNHTYRIVRCKASQRGMPPIFDGSETLITHNCVGRVFAVMADRFTMRPIKNWME